MSTILTSPDITGIGKLFEIYQSLPDRDRSIVDLTGFYEFLSVNSCERRLFLEAYCNYSFLHLDNVVILKLEPRDDH